MYKDEKLQKSYKINSCYHDLNPLIKILCFIIFSVVVLVKNDIVFLGIVSILLLCLILMSNVKISLFLSELNRFKYLLLIIFIFNFIIKIDLVTNITILLKIIFILFYYCLIIFTTNFESVNYGFNKLLTPFKFLGSFIDKVSFYITCIFMFIPNYILMRGDSLEKMSLRGLDYNDSNIIDKFKIFLTVSKDTLNNTFVYNKNKNNAINIRMVENSGITFKKRKIGFGDIFILFTHVFVVVVVILKGVIV